MNKPLLTFAALAILAVARPGVGTAAPAPGSTEDADRQFLAHLEASDAEQSHSTEAAPAPVSTTTTSRAHDSKPPQSKASTPKKAAPVAKASNPIRRLPSGEVADDELTPPAVASAPAVAVVTVRDRDHDHDHDEDHHFFHRLFSHLLSKHPEDW